MIQFNQNTIMHLSKKNIQYITTFTVQFKTLKSIYQMEEYKSWSSLVPCIPQELKVGASGQCERCEISSMYSALC